MLYTKLPHLQEIANIIKYHHVYWDNGNGSMKEGEEIPLESHVLHLADRIAVLIKPEVEILEQAEYIRTNINENSPRMFVPELVEAFNNLASKEYFWLDIVSSYISSILSSKFSLDVVELNSDDLLDLSKIFCQIIDFRSRFTATHSSGVAEAAEKLAELTGFSAQECQQMKIAGYFHDLGKLMVPVEILEKPSKLTKNEYNIIRSHTFHTYRTLEEIEELNSIIPWAAYHHERLDGKGYPFQINKSDLSLGSRIMAVADIFTAITEDRPYRNGSDTEKTLKIMKQMVDNQALDGNIVDILIKNYDYVYFSRNRAQQLAAEEYDKFISDLNV